MNTKIEKNSGIFYEIIGSLESNKTILFIHGAGGNMEMLKPIASKLEDCKCVLINLPGHQGSLGEVPDSLDKYIPSLKIFIESLKNELGDDISVVGHSLGGLVVLLLGLEKIPSIKRLIILNSGGKISIDKKFIDKLKNGKIDKFQILKWSGSPFDLRLLKFLFNKRAFESDSVTIKDFITGNNYDIRHKLIDIDIPVLIVAGEKDELTTVEHAMELKEIIEDSKVEVISKVSHLLPVVACDKASKLIREFI
ncbi:alpha/beta fold hydrolase [Alkaliphilus sp. B6464]|uniref:alpha/beta fold hydrolase n=1 Tax=Alkaliphilus sp. B6464 TaxID=2731219 RepID=UPI001BADA469|nr:alpha/beta hydrolase [Alkaliphilus sp. B6464]QUH21770.1 alpha/beta hydrolase [Alkaliphilus sp. B6464]